MLPPIEELKVQIEKAAPGCRVEIIPNEPTGQVSLALFCPSSGGFGP